MIYGKTELIVLEKGYSRYIPDFSYIFKPLGIIICAILGLIVYKYIILIKKEKSNIY